MTSYRNSDPRPPIMVGSPPPPEMRPPMIDWDRPPWNRLAFQNIRQILPTAAIRRADVPSPLPTASGDLDGFEYLGPGGRETSFGQMLDETYTDAIFVWKNGRVLHESYHNGMTPRTTHLLQSVSKSVTAAAAGCLIGEGKLDPTRPITDYLPELAATAWRGATLGQVIDMTSGAAFDESDYANRESDVGKMDFASGWKPAPEGVDAAAWPTCIWDQILGLKAVNAEHGARFEYRSIETDVMAHAMERVTGQRLPQIISERIWQPLGCAEDADMTVDQAGYGLASGGICASLRDMARFGLMLLGNGSYAGRQVVPSEWCQDIRHGKHGLFDPENNRNWPKGRYRNQFWIEDSTAGRLYCFGIFGQMVMVAPDSGMVAVKLSTWPMASSEDFYARTVSALRAIEQSF